MATDLERRRIWENLIGAETRALYFADISQSLQSLDRRLTIAIFSLSSGSVVSILASWFAGFALLQAALSLAVAILSGILLFSRYTEKASLSAHVHFQWNRLATEYEDLWGNLDSASAERIRKALEMRGEEISKAQLPLPYRPKLMERWMDHVVQQKLARYRS